MAVAPETAIMALFCDFENVALGVRDAKYDKFDIKPVLERLLLKGSIVVKKAYCDWERYKGFKATMHEASFELIEIPHLRQSGKNSADIRLVVDALDLCYTKAHVDTFVIISGDSDFSPLVSKLRENAKYVIGVGVKQSTSDLLIGNCDEFIFYDDLVREMQRSARRDARESPPAVRRSPEEEAQRRAELDARRSKAIELAVATFDALVDERGDSGKIWASMLKEAIKRRKPDFSESYYGFRAFGNLLEEAQARGLLELGRDEKSGTYISRGSGLAQVSEAPAEAVIELPAAPLAEGPAEPAPVDEAGDKTGTRRKGEGRRKAAEKGTRRARGAKEAKDDEAPSAEATGAPAVAAEDRPPDARPVIPADFAEAAEPAALAPLPPAAGEAPSGAPSALVADERAAEGLAAENPEEFTAGERTARPARKAPSRPRRPRVPKPVAEET
ncbi:NYN domain-containing protein [Accumulibacter sp.]|uniref:NYN domain-containing protein n=1 Tax=Accumulibacter sp. TaxID=2053492 RepID=UPI0025D5AB7B|nr:NYN domain-containing protein [Accumulibacter sp.]MCM8593973.1 NYN domain-containing protein [Accumulibacter sp.]MCM8624790.1 NYN domain-containing protein [Accumulibacter sp.]MDS4048115.1 NYN domain-containing protein [Accumulibacter sp.]